MAGYLANLSSELTEELFSIYGLVLRHLPCSAKSYSQIPVKYLSPGI
jgi:hypothetical protein